MRLFLLNLIYAGHIGENSADIRKQILISSLFSLISIILLFVFGLDGIRTGRYVLAAIVLAACVINAGNYIFLKKTGRYRTSSYVIVALMTSLCIYLLCTGGSGNTGPLWFFVLPILIFYILGLYRGRIVISLLFLFVLFLLYVPENPLLFTTYPLAFTHRFAGSLFSVCVLAYAYEYTRKEGEKELLALSEKLDTLSRKDELTGLSNRRDIVEKLKNEKNRFERNNQPFSVLVIDIDHFKQVNDSHGHNCGDYVLQQVASTFVNHTQKRDGVARWGGEEFLIILSETTLEQAKKIAERLRKEIESLETSYENSIIKITISIGVTLYEADQSITDFINYADQLLYNAKESGRNRVIVGNFTS